MEYFSGDVWNSGRFMGIGIPRADRRRKGEITEAPGERRPFSPYVTNNPNRENWTMFHYLGVRKGWADNMGDFIEDYYRANWVDGIDLISLDAYNFGYASQLNPDNPVYPKNSRYPNAKFDTSNPIQRWAIGVILGKDFLKNPDGDMNRAYPSDYLHTIELPHKVAQMIYAYDHKQGEQFFSSIKRAIAPPPASTPPMESMGSDSIDSKIKLENNNAH